MNNFNKGNVIVDASVQPTTTLTPAKESSSKVNSSFSSHTEALTNDTEDTALQQNITPSMTNCSKTQNSNVPQIVTFESPIRRKRRYSFSSTSDHPADCCNTDVDLDTDLSGEDIDSKTTDSNNSTITSLTAQESSSKNDLQSQSQVSSPEFTIASPNNDKGVKQQTVVPSLAIERKSLSAFTKFRLQYLFVHTAIMLADGLQGTHLYVLYEGYGYSVASLYAIGFVSGAITSPFIGPVVDKIGRKRAAIIYCLLEMIINYFEQYPIFLGLISSRVLGGITTNLLFTVFESWLVTEHRKRAFEEEKLEIILRDSTIVSNSAAIVSGYLAHCLAAAFGPVGPFEGAVAFTAVALVVVGLLWSENYGGDRHSTSSSELSTFKGNMVNAYRTIIESSNISRIGVVQGLTEGSLQTFVFLWAPALRTYAASASSGTWGLENDGEPAYGLIFGSFMAFGVAGGFLEPTVRKSVNSLLPFTKRPVKNKEGEVDPISVHSLCILCYSISALVLITPCILPEDNANSFIVCFAAFLVYELMIGLYMPCEGVVRSIYMPNESICSLMTMLRVIVNVAVAAGVISTTFIPFTFAFGVLSTMMVASACIQMSLLLKHRQLENEKKLT